MDDKTKEILFEELQESASEVYDNTQRNREDISVLIHEVEKLQLAVDANEKELKALRESNDELQGIIKMECDTFDKTVDGVLKHLQKAARKGRNE